MASNAAETVIGAVVLAVAAGFLTYASQTAGLGTGGDNYAVHASFANAEGLGIGTDVRMAGVKIGSVTALRLDRETYQAKVEMALQNDVLLPDDSDVKISSEGLLGGAFVEISAGGSEFMLKEGDEITFTQSAVSFLNLLLKFATGGEDK